MSNAESLRKLIDIVTEVKINNKTGKGAVPNNVDIDYFGLRVAMKPSTFLKLAKPLRERVSVDFLKAHIQNGGEIGAPFLQLRIPDTWEDSYEWDENDNKVDIAGDLSLPAKVVGHEGRNRMTAIMELEGDVPVEVHIFPGGWYRRKHLTPEIIGAINSALIPEDQSAPMKGPFFKLM